MEVKACLKYTRVGAQRARLVADLVRGKNVNQAIGLLSFSKKKSAGLIKALIESAVANAEQKQMMDIDNLYVKTIYVNQGPHLKPVSPGGPGGSLSLDKKNKAIFMWCWMKSKKRRLVKTHPSIVKHKGGGMKK